MKINLINKKNCIIFQTNWCLFWRKISCPNYATTFITIFSCSSIFQITLCVKKFSHMFCYQIQLLNNELYVYLKHFTNYLCWNCLKIDIWIWKMSIKIRLENPNNYSREMRYKKQQIHKKPSSYQSQIPQIHKFFCQKYKNKVRK